MKFPPVACLLACLAMGGVVGCRQLPVGQTVGVGTQKSLPHPDRQDSETDSAKIESPKIAGGEQLHTMSDPFLVLASDVSEPLDEFLVQLTGEIVEYGEPSKVERRKNVTVADPVVASAESKTENEEATKPATWRQFEPRSPVVIEAAKPPSSLVAPAGDFQMPLIVPAQRESAPAVVQPENTADTGVEVVVPDPVELPEKPLVETKVETGPKGLTGPSFPALPGVTDLGT